MALPETLPPHWLNTPVTVAYGAPLPMRDGSLKFATFEASVVADYPQMVELETSDSVKLYPKNAVAYLTKPRTVATATAKDVSILLK